MPGEAVIAPCELHEPDPLGVRLGVEARDLAAPAPAEERHVLDAGARAHELDSSQWSERMQDQVDLLRGIQAARCPNDVPVDTAAEAFAQLMKLAAKGAVAYFTFGAAGF